MKKLVMPVLIALIGIVCFITMFALIVVVTYIKAWFGHVEPNLSAVLQFALKGGGYWAFVMVVIFCIFWPRRRNSGK